VSTRDLAFGVHQTGETGRRDPEGLRHAVAEHRGSGIDLGDIAQDGRVKLDVAECLLRWPPASSTLPHLEVRRFAPVRRPQCRRHLPSRSRMRPGRFRLRPGAARETVGSALDTSFIRCLSVPGFARILSRLKPRRPFFVLRESIRDVVPCRPGTDKDVLARTGARITIDGSQHHLTDCSSMCTCQWGAASLAEAPRPTGGGLVALDKVLA